MRRPYLVLSALFPALLLAGCGGTLNLPAADTAPAASAAGTSAPPQPAPPAPWQRVVVIGASASAGFGTGMELGEDVPLAALLEPMLRLEHEPARSYASAMFFLDPTLYGGNQVADALEAEPTLVLALDFLFWYVYGLKPDEATRLRDLEQGLALLDEFSCPVLVSLIPDMSPAVGKMLLEGQVPKAETFPKVNQRIREWAAQRRNAVLVPMNELVDEVRSGRPVRVGASQWPQDASARMIQADDLHPTVEGLAALAATALQTLARDLAGVPLDAFTLDPLQAAEQVRAERLR
ncbi:MAG: hypothetical protein EYC70_16095 [Planctomycetota bacterium]|nr:MAG: hypothetical protein EYC70_16095 [Planctomycetota bacterium]